jgi:hypothetical protein
MLLVKVLVSAMRKFSASLVDPAAQAASDSE